jgi:adenosyl cobinamide kinase/adenosyl cobinamide phosphate guanylyltransferase
VTAHPTPNPLVTLVLGGTRSGKSRVAEGLVASAPHVTYVATAAIDPADTDHAARIARHRERRPEGWVTVECPDAGLLAAVLAALDGWVLVDSLGRWVAAHDDGAEVDPTPLVEVLAGRTQPTVVVSEEVGLSLHAPTAVGRRFVDALGETNQAVAAVAGRVLLVVAGRALELPAEPDPSC